MKRPNEDTQQEDQQNQQGQERPWSTVLKNGRRQRPVQYGTSKVNVAGGEARPYDVVIGNTHPGSTEEIIKDVLQKVAQQMPDEVKLEEPLEINA